MTAITIVSLLSLGDALIPNIISSLRVVFNVHDIHSIYIFFLVDL